MQPKTRFFISDRQLGFREIRWFRAKAVGIIASTTVALLTMLLSVNHFYYDFLGLGYGRVKELVSENTLLKEQIRKTTVQFQEVNSILSELSERGNELRLLVDLPRLDEDTRRAGIGGGATSNDFALAGTDAQSILSSSQELLDKLLSEARLQRKSYVEIDRKAEYNQELFRRIPALKPMDGYYSPSGFGLRMHPVLGIFRTHEGLDIVADVGTPVFAAGDGVVEFSGHSGSGYGSAIMIDHGFGYQSLYAHLSKLLVKEGKKIKRGDLIGRSGRSGLVSGPHLHYEVHHYGVKKNPIDFFLDDLRPADYRSKIASSQQKGG